MIFESTIQICGMLGIFASVGVVIADSILLGRSDSDSFMISPKRTVGMPFWRIKVGNLLGLCLIPLVALGFLPLFYALEPIGFFPALITTGLLGYVFILGPGGHTFYAYNGSVYRVREGLAKNSPEAKALDSVMQEHEKILTPLKKMILPIFLIGSLVYSIVVLTGMALLPTWMAIINPFLLSTIAGFAHRWAPTKIAGYIQAAGMYAGVIPLQVLTLLFMWNVVVV